MLYDAWKSTLILPFSINFMPVFYFYFFKIFFIIIFYIYIYSYIYILYFIYLFFNFFILIFYIYFNFLLFFNFLVFVTPVFVFQVVVLNTNLYYVGNKMGTGDADPCGQLAWLKNILQDVRASGNKVGLENLTS